MWKTLLQKLKKPPVWLLVLNYILTVVFCAVSIVTLFWDNGTWWYDTLCYTSYAVAAITLAYSTYTIIKVAPKTYRQAKEKLRENPITGKLMRNYGLRTVIFAAFSTLISLSYAVYNGVVSLLYHSPWYGALAVYYLLLLAMRGSIVLYHGKHRGRERQRLTDIRKYRFCGVALMVMIITLSAAVVQMVVDGAGFEKPGIMIYVSAAYTFTKLTMAIVNFIKAKKQTDFTVDALRNINAADALVAVLALQTAMMYEFSDGTGAGLANALTGTAVCLLVFALGLYMVIRSVRATKKDRKNGEENATEQEI